MSKAETIDALMESAVLNFSKDGYEGASLRDIARHAGVPLSTIHLYFGSKAELFQAVTRLAWDELDAERHKLLDEAFARSGDQAPPIEDLLHALAFPVARRALSTDPRDKAGVFLLRSIWQLDFHSQIIDIADRSMVRFMDAVRRNHPTLSRSELIWAFSYVVGAIYSWQLLDHRYDRLIGDDDEHTPEDVTGDIVAFCRSGLQAVVDRHATKG